MGPQLYRCGNKDMRHRVSSYRQLQWGRNFIVAETDTTGCRREITCTCFNGAATLSLRKYRIRHQDIDTLRPASMGPQLYRCGNVLQCSVWRDGMGASMGPQLYRYGNDVLVHRPYLSWLASMGPQLYRCGNIGSDRLSREKCRCFNGAATLSLRKCTTMQCMARWHGRFNGAATLSLRKLSAGTACGPRLSRFNGAATLSLRKQPARRPGHRRYNTLQWGRNFIVAETRVVGRTEDLDTLASMGPQLYRCGNCDTGQGRRLACPASMGPQLYRCGN